MFIFKLFKKINNNNSKIAKIIVGLGNPTPKYENTRHNAGFKAIDYIAKNKDILINKRKFSSLFGDGFINNTRCIFLKPLNFINNSGDSVEEFKNYYKLKTKDLIVLTDDINFNVGKIKIKKNGSSGGHNGVKSIIHQTGEEDFVRIKIGIKNKFLANKDPACWVLSNFSKEEQIKLEKAFENVLKAVELILEEKIEMAMNLFN